MVVAYTRADDYRYLAQQCLEMARTFKDPTARASLTYMAETWLRLADTYETNTEGVGRSKPAAPVLQQQQQLKGDKE